MSKKHLKEFIGFGVAGSFAHHLEQVLDAIEQHHEKLDGSGYPNGLQGKEIDLLSQIITIADIFDALTTKRSYKKALKTFEALEIMKHKMAGELSPLLLAKFILFMSDKIDKADKNKNNKK